MRSNPLPNSIEYAFEVEVLSQVPISKIMEYLITNNIIKDEEILNSWKKHFDWYTQLEEMLFPVSIADFAYPDAYSDSIYTYSDISVIQRFADLFTNVTEISFCPESLDSQYIVINEMLPYIVDVLIPTIAWGADEVSVEKITELVQKLSVYLAKLFWIYTL